MKTWARIEIGATSLGYQARCLRHDLNLLHVDFEGHVHPANMGTSDVTPENAEPNP